MKMKILIIRLLMFGCDFMKINKNNKSKKKIASALKYDIENDNAPVVIAKGQGHMASRIIDKAKEEEIPVYEDEKLAEQLDRLELNQEIPRELYEAVAQILLFISNIDVDNY